MKPLRHFGNERGIALVTALLLTLLSLAFIMALLYIVTQGGRVSAANKRYKSALEASYGGVEVFTKGILPQLLGAPNSTDFSAILAGNAPRFNNHSCIDMKLGSPNSSWGGVCRGGSTNADPTDTPDVTFKLKGPPLQPNFNVSAKIVDSQPGNSDTSGMEALDSAAGVAYGASGVSPKHIPGTYRIEVHSEKETNPLEKANLSVLYAY